MDAATRGSPTRARLGAWILKCDPEVWDLRGLVDDGGGIVETWTVSKTRRSGLMTRGDPVLLWATGNGRIVSRGFWGSGRLTGPRFRLVDPVEDLGPTNAPRWRKKEMLDAQKFAVPMALRVWTEPVPKSEMENVPELADIEPIYGPQIWNPNWITVDELPVLERFLPPWPDIDALAREIVTVGSSGVGFGDPETRKDVETAAIDAVEKHYRSRNHTVVSVERENCGWDLTCTAPDGTISRVEVKGVAGSTTSVLLTRNEYRSAGRDPGWVLAVVTRAVTAPTVTVFGPDEVRTAATPYVYRADLVG